MSEVKIILPDGSHKLFPHEPTGLEIAQSIGARLAQDTLGVRVNKGEIQDLRFPIPNNSQIELITTKSKDAANDVIRHSAAHIMAQAVQSIWSDVKVTIGPVIDTGFYYDFDSPRNFTEEDFEKIEKKIQEIVSKDYPIVRREMAIDEAIATFKKMGERFKVELIQDLKAKGERTVGICDQGDWFDLCKGPHVQRTGQVKAVKLLSVAGAYWRGDEKNPMLQRIYATAFGDKKELDAHLVQLEEAKKRDHRKLGKDLGLFHFSQIATASPFFTGKGTIIYNELQKYMRELYFKYGYQEVITPQIFDTDLFVTSGHMANYKENMYFTTVDERQLGVKPMNCPSHCILFKSEHHSYRELPLRMADFGRLHRYEKSGAIHGLTRVRSFCQDDAHIFCSMDQLQSEIVAFMSLLREVYEKLGMPNFKVFVSTRPTPRMGTEEFWDASEGALKSALDHLKIPYQINEGDGAFYAPKIDIQFVDAIGRPWQLGTLQCDPNLPQAFDLKYAGEDNKEHTPLILHRAVLGSLERFIGVYLEHTSGNLPAWMSPVQVSILSITDRVNTFCEDLKAQLKAQNIRVEFDLRNEKLSRKVLDAQNMKIPYMLVIGDKEAEAGTASLRLRSGQQLPAMKIDMIVEMITGNIKDRSFSIDMTNKEVSH
jgi:threonyl-tRNA synthetase